MSIGLGVYIDETELAELHQCLLKAIKALMEPERDYAETLKQLRRAREVVNSHVDYFDGR